MNAALREFFNMMKTSGRAKTPKGYTSNEIVRQAIEFNNPPRVPYSFITHNSDIIVTVNWAGMEKESKAKNIGEQYKDAWGVTWEVTGKLWDHAVGHPLEDLNNLDDYKFPDFNYDQVNGFTKMMINLGKKKNKYVLGLNTINLFEQLRSLMGFEGVMMAPYIQPEKFRVLLDKLGDLTCELIDNYELSGGVDGFMTIEDWGLQKGLQMSLDQFREFYKPVYQRIINHCHSKGYHYFWHCCGDIITLIPEMVEMGVDVVQLDQPSLMGYENLIKAGQNKICFFNCVDIQWSAKEETTVQMIGEETHKMMDVFKTSMPKGGLILKHYTQPWDIGLPKKKYRAIAKAYFSH